MPDLNSSKDKLYTIPGSPPNLLYPPKGDAFAPRNPHALNIDFRQEPPMFRVTDTHWAATWLLHEAAPRIGMPDGLRQRIEQMRREAGHDRDEI